MQLPSSSRSMKTVVEESTLSNRNSRIKRVRVKHEVGSLVACILVGSILVSTLGSGMISHPLESRAQNHLLPSSSAALSGSVLLSVVANITVDNGPTQIVYNPFNGYMYVASETSSTVSAISSSTNTVVATIHVGVPRALAYDPANHDIFVCSWSTDSVAVISPTNTLVANITGAGGPIRLVYNPSNSEMYVINHWSHDVWAISSSTNTVVTTIPISLYPVSIDFDPANTDLYVATLTAGPSGTVSVISGASNTVLANVTVPYGSSDLTFDPTNNDIYMEGGTAQTNFVAVVSGLTNQLIATIPVATSPLGLIYNPANGNMYVGGHLSDLIQVISSTTNSIIANVTGVFGPIALAYRPDDQNVYAVTGRYNGALPIGDAISISSITNTVVTRLSVGFATDIAYDPQNGNMYLSNYLSNTVVALGTTVSGPIISGLVFSPSPVATPGSLTPGQTVSFTVTAEDSTGSPVGGGAVYLASMGTFGYSKGTFQVLGTTLSSIPSLFLTASDGMLPITFTTPTSSVPGGADMILASTNVNGGLKVVNLYDYSGSLTILAQYGNQQQYTVEFFVDQSKLGTITNTVAGPYGLESNYLSMYLESPTTLPVYGALVYEGTSRTVVSQTLSASIVFDTIAWAWNYYHYKTGELSRTYESIYNTYRDLANLEWLQEAAILGVHIADISTLITSLLNSAHDLSVSKGTADQMTKLGSLVVDMVLGPASLAQDFSSSQAISAVLHDYGLVNDPTSYTGDELVNNLANMDPQRFPQFVQSVYSKAYGSSLDSQTSSLATGFVENLGQTAITAGAKATLASSLTFANAFFTRHWHLLTSAASSLDKFGPTFAKSIFGKMSIITLAASIITSVYLLPMANLEQEEVNLENAIYNDAAPAVFSTFNSFFSNGEANVTNGPAAFYSEGLTLSLDAAWFYYDYQLESLQFAGNLAASDFSYAESLRSNTISIYQALESLRNSAVQLVQNIDPGPIDFSGILANPGPRPALTDFPTNNVLLVSVQANDSMTIQIGGHTVQLNQNFARSSSDYPYALAMNGPDANNNLVLCDTPAGELFVRSLSGSVVDFYLVNSSSVSLLWSQQVQPGSILAVRLARQSNDRLELLPGGSNVSFVENGLPAGTDWQVTIDGNSFSSESDRIDFEGLAMGVHQFSIMTNSNFRISPSSGEITSMGADINLQVTFQQILPTPANSKTPAIRLGPSIILFGSLVGVVSMMVIIGLVLLRRNKRNHPLDKTMKAEGSIWNNPLAFFV